ncbi:hypothetical protein WMF31_12005 [Sorangium sp. So ce1036]|uniref:hypothetical protein n=1 Tax=Sorangium sp. So ce1036 TaxID=3133328 RepID=UPI003F0CB5CD
MRRPRLSSSLLIFMGAAVSGAGAAVSCSAAGIHGVLDDGSGDGGGGGGGGDDGFGNVFPSDGGPAPTSDVAVNPCGSACGPTELCDQANLGLDDDCDGMIDEECACIPGQASSCFRGDPSYRSAMGCFPGTQLCLETGTWGPCVGGLHADQGCFSSDATGCHAMQAPPFANVDLKEGTGSFSDDAVAGTEVWKVTCPAGIDPCPGVEGEAPPDDFTPLQSGEYRVRYTKGLANGGTESCEYPLFVGARGLRVELEWEHDRGSIDLDLHLHAPVSMQPWEMAGSAVDCGWNNCTVDDLSAEEPQIRWFSDLSTPPDPVNWFLDPVESNNTCYYAPRGVGEAWRSLRKGCHSPRLDLDNVSCDPTITDPDEPDFCAPENINVDFPPSDQWMRIGVHYYGALDARDDVHPRVKIYCNRALRADLGPKGYYTPEQPVTFAPRDAGTRFWLVADVLFPEPDECGQQTCIVQPIYHEEETKSPRLTTELFVEESFGPDYPPLP